MGVVVCGLCTGYIDLDWDTDGVWPDVDHDKGPDYVCGSCLDQMNPTQLKDLGYDENHEPIRSVH